MSVFERIAEDLALDGDEVEVERQVAVSPDVHVDAILRTPEEEYLVELKSDPPTREAVADIVLARTLRERDIREGDGPSSRSRVIAVLAGPRAGNATRRLAREVEVKLVEVPASLLPAAHDRVGQTPLTTPKSWAILTALFRQPWYARLQDLAGEAGTSLGWTSEVVRELEARGAVRRPTGGVELKEEEKDTVFDAVTAERPFEDLLSTRIPTGMDDASRLDRKLSTEHDAVDTADTANTVDTVDTADTANTVETVDTANAVVGEQDGSGFVACGVTAASFHAGDLLVHDRLDVYCGDPEPLEALFEDASGGIDIRVFSPDRDIVPESTLPGGLPCVSKPQALLDVAGTGMAFRDLATELADAMKEE